MTRACGFNPELPVPGGDFVQPTGWYGSKPGARTSSRKPTVAALPVHL